MGQVEKSHGAYKFDNSQDAQKSIQNTIQNDGAFIPTALAMIQNLRSITNGQNPTAIQSVGAANFAQAVSAISAMFNQNKTKNSANTDPCSIPVNQRTPQQQYDCEVETSISLALSTANTTNTTPDNTISDQEIADAIANTAAYTQAIVDVSNTIVSNTLTVNALAATIETFIMADSNAVNTIANAASNDVVTIIVANTTQVNTIANTIVQSFIASPTLAANVANSIQTPIATDLLANAAFVAALKTAMGF